MKLFLTKLCILAAATQLAVSATADASNQRHHSITNICGSDEADSFASTLNDTSICFNSHERAAPVHHHGKTVHTTTGNSVYQQFTGMNVDARKCSVTLTSDPYLDDSKPGMSGIQVSEFSWRTYVDENKGDKSTNMYTGVRVLDKKHGYNWIDSRLDLYPTGKIDYVFFDMHGAQCFKNVKMACNAGATNWQFGEIAIEFANTFWEYTFGINGVDWENCGPDNSGIRPKQFRVTTLTIAPVAMTGTLQTFTSASSFKAGDGSDIKERTPTCYTRFAGDIPGEQDITACP